jgi:ABC-type transport system substrate-binding protein
MNVKKALALILAILMIGTLLAACGNGDSTTPDPTPLPDTGTTPDTSTTPDDDENENEEVADVHLPGTVEGTGNVWREGQQNEWQTADIQKTTNDVRIPEMIFDKLIEIRFNADGTSEFVPSLATSWTISEDGTVYTFQLRENVLFHNGEVFKADDVLYTIERMMDPTQDIRWVSMFNMVAGAQDKLDGNADHVSGVRVINDYEVEITLNGPFAGFMGNLAFVGTSILNRKGTEDAGDEFGINPALTVGTGAFRYVEWELNDYHRLEAFTDHWRGRPSLDGVLIRVIPELTALLMVYQQGELDHIGEIKPTDAEDFMAIAEFADHVVPFRGVNIAYLHLNQRIEPMNDVRIRRAMQLAVDRQAILDSPLLHGGNGIVHSGIMPAGLMGYNPNLPVIPFDPDEAMRLMAEAGYPDGFEVTFFQLPFGQADYMTYVNELIQAQLREVGITVFINTVDSGSWGAIRGRGDMGPYNATWGAAINDPGYFFNTFFTPGTHVGRSYNIQRTDLLERVEAANFITDHEARMREYQELEILLIQEEAAWIPLYSYNRWALVHPRLVDWVPDWTGGLGFHRDFVVLY